MIEELQMPKPRRNSIDLSENQLVNTGAVATSDDPVAVLDKKYENQVSDFSYRRHTDKMERRDLSNSKKEFTTQKIRQEWAEHEHEVQLMISEESAGKAKESPTAASQPDTEEAVREVAEEELVETKEDMSMKEESKSKKKRRKKSIMKKKSAQRKNSTSSSNGSTHSEHPDHDSESISSSQKTTINASSSTDNSPIEASLSEFPNKPEDNSKDFKPICVEPHTPDNRIRDLDIHFFSDTEVATGTSRSNSRPNTPIQSDTEFEMNRSENSNPSATMTHSQSWKWGELPTPNEMNTAEGKQSHRNSVLSGMFSFMKQNNKIRKGVSEGLYLSDLDAEGMDPEVAALYFPKKSFNTSSSITIKPNPTENSYEEEHQEDDRESGNGTSLPQSPSSIDLGLKSIDSDYDDGKDKYLDFIAMSMSGGLDQPGGPTKEEFDQSLVSYSEVGVDCCGLAYSWIIFTHVFICSLFIRFVVIRLCFPHQTLWCASTINIIVGQPLVPL